MVIGLDIGSSSVKALRLGGRSRRPLVVRRGIATRRAGGGRVEHDGAEILRAALEALRAAGGGSRGAAECSLAIATQRSTLLFWDRAGGRPLTPAYSWQDLRGASICTRLRRRRVAADDAGRRGRSGTGGGAQELIAARTGLRLSPHYSASKIAWALRHVRGLRRRVEEGGALWGPLGTFLLWHLSGGALYAVDHANAQRTLLLDLATLSWDPELFGLFGLEALLRAPALPALLPTVLRPGLPLRLDGRRLRLRAMTGDQQAALFGMRRRRAGDTVINYGSGAFLLRNVGARPVRVLGLLTPLLASWRAATPACMPWRDP
jgi:glycerol kinase